MSQLEFRFFPLTLQMNWEMTITLPKKVKRDEKLPLVYLLHDDQEGSTTWTRYVGLERIAEQYHVAIVTSDAAQGLYTDMKDGYDFFQYLSKEWPSRLHQNFNPLTEDFSKTLFIGKGIGAYGAAKWALHNEKAPAAVLAVNPVLQVDKWQKVVAEKEPARLHRMINAWGADNEWEPEVNLLDHVTRVSSGERIPLDGFRTADYEWSCDDAFREKLEESFVITPHKCDETNVWKLAEEVIEYGIRTYLK